MADPQSRAGSSYSEPAVREFVDGLHHVESPAMRDAVRSMERTGMPAIQIGPGDGAILAVLLAASGARRVVEIGTLSGYSALWIERALPPEGHLWTLESDRDHARVARGVLARAGLSERVTVLEGPALDVLPTLEPEGPFDAVFVDADKRSYSAYGRWALANLRSGGLLLADNAFLFGYLAGREPDARAGADAIASMRAFHELLARRCPISACIPTPDGLVVGIVP